MYVFFLLRLHAMELIVNKFHKRTVKDEGLFFYLKARDAEITYKSFFVETLVLKTFLLANKAGLVN